MKQLCTKDDKLLFATVLDMWLLSNKVHIKHSTYDKYCYMIEKHILPCLGSYPLETINTVIINNFLDEKLKSGGIDTGSPLSPSYVGTMSLIISSTIQFAANEDLCRELKNPIFKPSFNNTQIKILSNKDSAKLADYICENPDVTGLGILLALFTGLRIGEVCALKWSNVDFRNKEIYINSTISRVKNGGKTAYLIDSPKTEASTRIIPIPKRLLGILKDVYSSRTSNYVASNKESYVIPRTFEYRYHKLLNYLEIESINFHALRHTFATNCIANGMDVKSLSEILGHSSVVITMQKYVHPSMELKRKQINKVFQ